MKTNVIKLNNFFRSEFLGSRHSGAMLRKQIDELLVKQTVVVLDFNNIRTITQSFGDEVVGIFVRAKGLDFVKDHIKITNADAEIRTILNFVVSYSNKRNSEHDDTLKISGHRSPAFV